MAVDSFSVLDQPEEDKLHQVRLLPIEHKPFQRVSKRLLQPSSLLLKRPSHLATPPPDTSEGETAERAVTLEEEAAEREQWREEMMLDFAALESTMVRIQLLQKSNERERERYAAEKIKILETAEAIKRNTTELRQQLEGSRQTMEQRKEWDELADKILNNKMLKSREEQAQMQEKLNREIAEQEQEMEEYARMIAVRRQQMDVIGKELKVMTGVLHPDQDEPDSQEGTEGEGAETRGATSQVNTPRPDMGDATPMPNHDSEYGGGEGLKLPPRSRAVSQAHSPGRIVEEDIDDVEMGEAVETPGGVESSTGEIEEGEASEPVEPMET